MMAQFGLKNRKIVPYHTGTAPMLEMARAYGIPP